MKIIQKDIAELKPYENNPRLNEGAVEYLKNSINEFGFRVPIVIDADNVIIAGHTRYKAAKELDLKKVPCIIADDLTEEQAKAFRLVDNRVSELAEWDYEKIYDELLKVESIDMGLMGFAAFIEEEENEKEQVIKEGAEITLDSFEDEKFSKECPCCGFRFN